MVAMDLHVDAAPCAEVRQANHLLYALDTLTKRKL